MYVSKTCLRVSIKWGKQQVAWEFTAEQNLSYKIKDNYRSSDI